MAASYGSVIARCCARKYRKFAFNAQATALGLRASLTALKFCAPRCNLIWCFFDGIPVIALGIAPVTAKRLNFLVEFLDCCWR
jgi:hypothetical protein